MIGACARTRTAATWPRPRRAPTRWPKGAWERGRALRSGTEEGRGLADARRLVREPATGDSDGRANTTIAVVATNARLTQAEATTVARMAHDGIARTVYPAHTPGDGDTVFTLATGAHVGDEPLLVVGALAADVLAEAIVRGVRAASSLPGLPAATDLAPGR